MGLFLWTVLLPNGFAIVTVKEIAVQTSGTIGAATANISLSTMTLTSTTAGTGIFYFGSGAFKTASPGVPATTMYIGPGQSVTYTLNLTAASGFLSSYVSFFGVEYVNV